ncbi:hypothetical protein LXL04_001896 [Taraxacum kok-saghyz]
MKQVWVIKGTLAQSEVLITKEAGEMFWNLKSKGKRRKVQKSENDVRSSTDQRYLQDYNRLISRLSIQTQMATIEDKFKLAVHSLKINQLAKTLGSGGCSLGKAIKRRYTNEGFTTFISSLKLTKDEITRPSKPEKKMKMSVKGLFTMIFINSQLAGVMSSSNGANILGEKERKDLRRLSKEFADDDVTIREPIRSDEDSYRTK